jgi:SAM-dependent methyltransferase
MPDFRDRGVEHEVRAFYDEKGWVLQHDNLFCDTSLFEDLRPVAARYISATRMRVAKHLPAASGRLLDAGCGPLQYPEYIGYSSGFIKRLCVDISSRALAHARSVLGSDGEYVQASILELPFEEGSFDAAISVHVLYHVDQEQQEDAVRELLRVVKRRCPVIIVYSNPGNLFRVVERILRTWREAHRNAQSQGFWANAHLYFKPFPLSWWQRFESECEIAIYPYATLPSNVSRTVPNNWVGKLFFRILEWFEDVAPRQATRLGAYPLVVLTKGHHDRSSTQGPGEVGW